MMSHNILLKGIMWKIIPKLSLLPLLIWSTAHLYKSHIPNRNLGKANGSELLDLFLPKMPVITGIYCPVIKKDCFLSFTCHDYCKNYKYWDR